MNTPLSSAYLRFVQLSRALSSSDEKALSANERALLEAIALAWFQKQPLTVLRASGFVEDQGVDADRRTKLLVPTSKALAFFDKLGGAMGAPCA